MQRAIFLLCILCAATGWSATEIVFGPPRRATQQEATLVPIAMPGQPVYVVPLFLADNPGDELGAERGSGHRIQALSISIRFEPAGLVWGAAFNRAGITTGLKTVFEQQFRTYYTASWMAVFDERRVPLPGAPGRVLIAELVMTSPPDIGTQPIVLAADPFPTAVSNQAGTVLQTIGHGLQFQSVTITVPK